MYARDTSDEQCRAAPERAALQSGLLKEHADFVPNAVNAMANLLLVAAIQNRRVSARYSIHGTPATSNTNEQAKTPRERA